MNNINSLNLALLGDAVYDLYIREYLIKKYNMKVNDIQTKLISYVSAKSQALVLEEIINKNILTEEEMAVYLRGRNAKVKSKPKNANIIAYKVATGFEALLGYLYLHNKTRLEAIIKMILEENK